MITDAGDAADAGALILLRMSGKTESIADA